MKKTLEQKVASLPEVGHSLIVKARILDKKQKELNQEKQEFYKHLNMYWNEQELKEVGLPVKNNTGGDIPADHI